MRGHSDQLFFERLLEESLGKTVTVKKTSFRAGGCINNALRLATSAGDFFVKWNADIPGDMFACEAAGLRLLRDTGELHIPQVLGVGAIDGRHYLLMEYVESTSKRKGYWEDFGRSLARLHKNHVNAQYGLDRNNYIGKLPQENGFCETWVKFFIEKRLEIQLQLALDNKLVDQRFANRYRKFYDKLPDLLPVDPPSLLHGDLWSGNVMTGANGLVSLIDPAVYFGHREVELAFTQLFGGFDPRFYSAYQEVYPLQPGFGNRVDIYNMYPLMVHVNLFGSSYLSGVESTLRRFS